MSERFPSRPRLADHVLPRRHLIDGREVVVLYDLRADTVMQVGPREWAVLEAADGTRDAEGIVVAARRVGAHTRVSAVEELLRSLSERGMIEPGEAAEDEVASSSEASREGFGGTASGAAAEASAGDDDGAVASSEAAEVDGAVASSEAVSEPSVSGEGSKGESRTARPLVAWADGLRCDGGGTCCRLYGTVTLGRHEALRVQAVVPASQVAEVPPSRWTTPMRGSVGGPTVAIIARNGACAFLQDDGLCTVHRVAGAQAKPLGCRLYPRILVDDGVEIRVSLKPECPCVLDPRTDEREAVVQPGWTDGASLPSTVVVDRLPESIALDGERRATRAELRAWVTALASREAPRDLAAMLWALARSVETHGLAGTLDAVWSAPPPPMQTVRPWIDALYGRASARAARHAAWRSDDDLLRRVSASVATTTLLLRDPEVLAEALGVPPEHPEQERRYWELGLHAYRWTHGRTLVTTLRDEAVRVWVARTMAALPSTAEPDLRSPLAVIEALLRAHGVGRYVDDLG